MPKPAIVRGSDQFFITTYEGNGTGQKVGNFVPFTDNGTIAKSAIFNSADTAYLSRTPSGAGNRRTFTISFWIKRAKLATTNGQQVLTSHTDGNNRFQIFFDASIGGGAVGNKLTCFNTDGGTNINLFQTTRTFEDTSKFYHILLAFDTTQATASNRMKLYVDGDQITTFDTVNYPSEDYQLRWNINAAHYIGRYGGNTNYPLDCYLAEFNNVDGTQLTPSTFGVTDTSTGRWIPKALTGITYGTNGFRLQFANSAGQTIGDDTGGGTNDFTVSNMTASDITTDTPTQNFANMGGRIGSSITLSEGNLKTSVGAADTHVQSNIALPLTGKWYWEVRLVTLGGYERMGIVPAYGATNLAPLSEGIAFNRMGTDDGLMMQGVDQGTAWDGAFHAGDIVGFAVDMDNKIFYISDNGTYRNSANPANVTGGLNFGATTLAANNCQLHPATGSGNSGSTNVSVFNFGQNPTFGGAITAGTETPDTGPGIFKYNPPTGFSSLCQDNFPETTKGIPDLVWIKNRDATDSHQLYDSSRGATKDLNPDAATAEGTTSDGLQKFLKGGISIEDDVSVNTSGESYVAWNWIANGGTTSANTDGSGATIASTIQANQTAGFSIVQWTGNNTSNSKIAHGLSQAPDWILVKNLTDATDWWLYHKDLTADKNLKINETAAEGTFGTGVFDYSGITNTVFEVDNGSTSGNSINGNTDSMIAYCWHEVPGFSSFGTYTGNANVSGPFIYTGFKPSFLIVKNRERATGYYMYDNKRTPLNQMDGHLFPDATTAETTGSEEMDFLSNGFKCRGDNSGSNRSAEDFIYMAFAEHPFIGDGTNPVTAK